MATTIDIGTMIVQTPDIRAGRPRIAGTGITVMRIAGWYQMGYGPEEIARKYKHLTLAQIYAAFTYYHANKADIDADIATEEAEIRVDSHRRAAFRLFLALGRGTFLPLVLRGT